MLLMDMQIVDWQLSMRGLRYGFGRGGLAFDDEGIFHGAV
jgi:hypothetical protein